MFNPALAWVLGVVSIIVVVSIIYIIGAMVLSILHLGSPEHMRNGKGFMVEIGDVIWIIILTLFGPTVVGYVVIIYLLS